LKKKESFWNKHSSHRTNKGESMSPLDKQREKLLKDYYEARKAGNPVMYEFANELFGFPFNMVVSELERDYQQRLKEDENGRR
jgi:hypothetical protein